MIRQKSRVSHDPQQQRNHQRIGAQAPGAQHRQRADRRRQRHPEQSRTNPGAVEQRVVQHRSQRGRRHSGIPIRAEQIPVIQQVAWPDKQPVVSAPHRRANPAGQQPRTHKRLHPIPARRPQHPEDRRKQEDARGLGEQHQRQQQPQLGCPGVSAPLRPLAHAVSAGLAAGLGRARRRGRKQRRQRRQDQRRLQDRQPRERITKGADGQQQHGNRRSQGGRRLRAFRLVALRSPHPRQAPHQQVDACQREPEDDNRQRARRCHAHPGHAEQRQLQQRPHRQRGCRIEVAGHVPVPQLVMPYGRVAVPAFIRVLRPVHPWRMIGKVGSQVDKVERKKGRRNQQQRHFHRPRNARRAGPLGRRKWGYRSGLLGERGSGILQHRHLLWRGFSRADASGENQNPGREFSDVS